VDGVALRGNNQAAAWSDARYCDCNLGAKVVALTGRWLTDELLNVVAPCLSNHVTAGRLLLRAANSRAVKPP
jgi:hypothetical protein